MSVFQQKMCVENCVENVDNYLQNNIKQALCKHNSHVLERERVLEKLMII